jgi:hypothetical protein
MIQMQANQHLLLQPWILAMRIGSIMISGNILKTTLRLLWCVKQHQQFGVRSLQIICFTPKLLAIIGKYFL